MTVAAIFQPAIDATTDNEGMTLILKFAWQHHVLRVDEFDSLHDALSSARYMADDGHESLDHIEVHEDGHAVRVIDRDEFESLVEPERKAEDQSYAEAPKPVALIEVKSNSDWARHDTFLTVDEAMAEAERLRAAIGDDRVRVMPLDNGLYKFRSEPIG